MMLILALKRLYEGVTGSLVAPFSILPGATARMNNPEGLFPSGERGEGGQRLRRFPSTPCFLFDS